MTANALFISLEAASAGRRRSRFVEPERASGPSLFQRIVDRLRTAAQPATAAARS